MAYRILSPANSFVQFGESNLVQSCAYSDITLCLPVYEEDDVYFQFIVAADSVEEADALCDLENSMVMIGLAEDCSGDLVKTFTEKPNRFRISDYQVLYNWSHGLPGFTDVIDVGKCFIIKVTVNDDTDACSNCFNRIASDCHTSVIEYGNEDNYAGFNYCNSAVIDEESDTCDPKFVQFTNQTTLVIPYTASMQAKYGNVPTLKVWIYDENGELTNMNVREAFDTYPPTELRFDFGGPATGIIKIN